MHLKSVLTAALTATALIAAPAVATAAPEPGPASGPGAVERLSGANRIGTALSGQAAELRSAAATTSTSAAASAPPVIRVSGTDRVGTAVAISEVAWDDKGGEYAPGGVVLARSDSFADSLAAAPLSVMVEGPLLLTTPTSVPAATLKELRRILPRGGQVYVLGGTGAISKGVTDSLAKEFTVTRLGGSNRFETAVRVAAKVDQLRDDRGWVVGDYVLTTGMNFPDGLAAGAAAGTYAVPVLLTNDGRMPKETSAYLAGRTTYDIAAVGGQAVAAVRTTPWANEDFLVYGSNRYETAAEVARRFFPTGTLDDPGYDIAWLAGVATGENWPDALAGSAHMAWFGGPLLLAQRNTLTGASGEAAAHLASRNDQGVLIGVGFGGEGVLSKRVLTQFESALTKR